MADHLQQAQSRPVLQDGKRRSLPQGLQSSALHQPSAAHKQGRCSLVYEVFVLAEGILFRQMELPWQLFHRDLDNDNSHHKLPRLRLSSCQLHALSILPRLYFWNEGSRLPKAYKFYSMYECLGGTDCSSAASGTADRLKHAEISPGSAQQTLLATNSHRCNSCSEDTYCISQHLPTVGTSADPSAAISEGWPGSNPAEVLTDDCHALLP